MNAPFPTLGEQDAEHLRKNPHQPSPQAPATLEVFSAAALQRKTFPPIKWLVRGILPEGLTLFAGKPKLGKSWAALDLACAVAEGGEFLGRACEPGDVLYLALEDNPRRLQDRLRCIRPDDTWPEKLGMSCEAPRLDLGGVSVIERWIEQATSPRLVIVDTLATVRPAVGGKEPLYQSDYAALTDLKRIADTHRVAVVVVHHVRKAEAEDPFDTVSGSTGLTGAADATLILSKRMEDGRVVLYGRGRDLKEFELGIEFDAERCVWKALGAPLAAFIAETSAKIVDAMKAGNETPASIVAFTGLKEANVNKTLRRMVTRGQAEKRGRGSYALTGAMSEGLSDLSGCQDGGSETDTPDISDSLPDGDGDELSCEGGEE